jgi:hypothetical protein
MKPPLTIRGFKKHRKQELDQLMAHFRSKGPDMAYKNVDALLFDMLDDVIDIWVEAHSGSDEGCDVY